MKHFLVILALTIPACGSINAPSFPATPRVAPVTVDLTFTAAELATPSLTEPLIPTPTSTPTPVIAAGFPDPNNYKWSLVVSDLFRPVDIQHAGDGSGRLFIIEQPGRIRVVQNGQLLAAPFLDITGRVDDGGNEQGLLGLAFHPNFEQNGFFYVNYTRDGGDTVIARFQVASDPNLADPNSETQLLVIDQPFGNHNGGVLAFGPDGYLYLGLGDGG